MEPRAGTSELQTRTMLSLACGLLDTGLLLLRAILAFGSLWATGVAHDPGVAAKPEPASAA
jgi:hypothetical protein